MLRAHICTTKLALKTYNASAVQVSAHDQRAAEAEARETEANNRADAAQGQLAMVGKRADEAEHAAAEASERAEAAERQRAEAASLSEMRQAEAVAEVQRRLKVRVSWTTSNCTYLKHAVHSASVLLTQQGCHYRRV